MLACDFVTVETICFQTLYLLLFSDLALVVFTSPGCTTSPDSTRVSQQARQLWLLSEEASPIRFLIHDRVTKFSRCLDSNFISDGIEVIRTPFRTPQANAVAERWVRSVREECLGQLLTLNQAHLSQVLREYAHHRNAARPYQGLQQPTPIAGLPARTGHIHRRDILHDYDRKSA